MHRKIIIISSLFAFIGLGLSGCASPQRTTHNPAHVFGEANSPSQHVFQKEVEKSFQEDAARVPTKPGTDSREKI